MLTLGKLRGLDAIAAPNGTFSMLALDHRSSFAKMTAGLFDGSAGWDEVVAEKERLARAMIGHATAVLMDPLFTAGPLVARGAIPGSVGFLVALERSGFESTERGRINVIEPGWTVEAIKRMGADGIKLLVQFHPAEAAAAEQEAFVEKIAASCREHDLVLVLEPISYAPGGDRTDPHYVAELPNVVVEIAKRFDPHTDLLKLEYPLLADAPFDEMVGACEAITAATRLPWVVLSGGVAFDAFLNQVRAACAGGASGFLGGRAIWKEAMAIRDEAARDAFLQRTAAPRIAALRAVSEASATPWRERPVVKEAMGLSEDWHKRYAGAA
ncbi:MAG: tagatose 1,6-diphosphate aldolase [Pseudomonadota bacterium]